MGASSNEKAELAWGLMPPSPLLAIHPRAQHRAFWLFHVTPTEPVMNNNVLYYAAFFHLFYMILKGENYGSQYHDRYRGKLHEQCSDY
jgi:hypothetical protein